MLVAWGQFAQCIGLVDKIQAISIRQKTVDHSPQSKVLEFLVANLAGLAHLKEISLSAHPLDHDRVVAQAWGQAQWADYSGVSRTLSTLSGAETEAICRVLGEISAPFMEKEALLSFKQAGRLILDGDLSGRSVSDTSQTYPAVAFGHMDDRVRLGYQAALVSLYSPTYGRLWLSVKQHPGDTVSCTEAEPMVRRSEAILGLRPLRRVELLQKRLEKLEKDGAGFKEAQEKARQSLADAQRKLEETQQLVLVWLEKVQASEALYLEKQRPIRPHSQVAQSRKKLLAYQKRQERRAASVTRAERRLSRIENERQAWERLVAQLRKRLEEFEQDNRTNSAPVPMLFRLDAGFGTPENIALLIEMGYEVYSKPHGNWLNSRLSHWVKDPAAWQRVGKNAEMVAWPAVSLSDFPYPLDLALERFHTGEQLRMGALIHFGQDLAASQLITWFERYNQRQEIEAGNKEEKQVFELHHLKVRSPSGICLQEQFVAFAANFVRWATIWMTQDCPNLPDGWFDPDQFHIKEQVKVGAKALAWVSWYEQGCLLRFEEYSVFAGKSLNIQKHWTFQPVLPFAKSCYFSRF